MSREQCTECSLVVEAVECYCSQSSFQHKIRGPQFFANLHNGLRWWSLDFRRLGFLEVFRWKRLIQIQIFLKNSRQFWVWQFWVQIGSGAKTGNPVGRKMLFMFWLEVVVAFCGFDAAEAARLSDLG